MTKTDMHKDKDDTKTKVNLARRLGLRWFGVWVSLSVYDEYWVDVLGRRGVCSVGTSARCFPLQDAFLVVSSTLIVQHELQREEGGPRGSSTYGII